MQQEEIIHLQARLASADDQQALEKLYLHFYPPLFRFARSLVRTSEVAEELVLDVFVKLWEKRVEAREIHNLRVYLYVAVRNKALNYRAWKSKDIISYFEAYPADILLQHSTPEQMLMTKEMAAKMDQAIHALPPRCKLIFKLVREDGLSYKEVAGILGISPRTVDTQMTIALKKVARTITLYTSSAPGQEPR
jgi:RNA polymerase sigma-70 factor (ECF subfamily)